MIKHAVRLVVSSAVVVAALTSASNAAAHEEAWIPAPRPLVQNDALDFMADQVSTLVTTTESSATVTTTLLTDTNYLYSIDIVLNCDDGTSVKNDLLPLSESSEDSRSCENGSKIDEAYVAIRVYGAGGHEEEEGGEEEGGEEEGGDDVGEE
jgi:hypothetical protein